VPAGKAAGAKAPAARATAPAAKPAPVVPETPARPEGAGYAPTYGMGWGSEEE
jgi:hypothetical protein